MVISDDVVSSRPSWIALDGNKSLESVLLTQMNYMYVLWVKITWRDGMTTDGIS